MKVAVTGGTGFIGQYIVRQLVHGGHTCRCWVRPQSHRATLDDLSASVEWVPGVLGDAAAERDLLDGVDAVVHAALYRPGPGFRGAEGDLAVYGEQNLLGSLRLLDAAFRAEIPRFVFISTCAVHEVVLDDRALDECHPMWPTSHYGAHKGAVEMFVHSFGLRHGWPVCSLRPTGVYGLHHQPHRSKWHDLVGRVAAGDLGTVTSRGGKEVHAADVARATEILLHADGVAGQSYNCYDRYVSEEHVAQLAASAAGLDLAIPRTNFGPKHHIDTTRIRALGMQFGGDALLEQTIRELLAAPR